MATATTSAHDVAARVNDLYWKSDRTVDEIASELGISRSTLYSAVEPLPVGESCAVCGGTLAFGNRTDRAAGVATCQGCGREMDVGEAGGDETIASGNGQRAAAWASLRPQFGEIDPRRAAMIGGAAAIGALVGVAAMRTIRH